MGPDGFAGGSEEERFFLGCFEAPDGWEEEAAQMERLGSSPDPQWTAPRIEGWPP
jgi:hypothetical protein